MDAGGPFDLFLGERVQALLRSHFSVPIHVFGRIWQCNDVLWSFYCDYLQFGIRLIAWHLTHCPWAMVHIPEYLCMAMVMHFQVHSKSNVWKHERCAHSHCPSETHPTALCELACPPPTPVSETLVLWGQVWLFADTSTATHHRNHQKICVFSCVFTVHVSVDCAV